MGKPTTIRRLIILLLIRTGFSIVAIFAFWYMFTQILIVKGRLLPANYAEQYIKNHMEDLKSVEKVTDTMMPYGATFSVFSSNGQYLYGNMLADNRVNARSVVTRQYPHLIGHDMYYIINRGNEICVIKYTMDPILIFGKFYFLHYNVLSIAAIIFCCVISLLCEINRISRRWFQCFKIIKNLTSAIRKKELDLDCPRTHIKEFDEIIDSMQDMGNSLMQSLKRQWDIEQLRNQQIASLAHDVKIPLTIIKGNAQLMSLADTDQERHEYTQSILLGESRIERYVDHILKISRLEKIAQLNKRKIQAGDWWNSLQTEAKELAKVYHLTIIENSFKDDLILSMDTELMSSAVLNLIMNACEYSPEHSRVYLEAKADGDFFTIVVKDSGPGFSDEAIHNAKTLFYMEDKSRGDFNHYGIGLTMADQIISAHNGVLSIKNTKDHHGCVTVKMQVQL